MKREYLEAELEVIELVNVDIVTASYGDEDVPEEEKGGWGNYY